MLPTSILPAARKRKRQNCRSGLHILPHGMRNKQLPPYRDVPVAPMYGGDSGHNLFPLPGDIAALDVLVVDLQDVGARYYTFYASMMNCGKVVGER